MKRKPTTKQTVRAELIRMVSELLTLARTTNHVHVCDSESSRARGAILLALYADIIDNSAHAALCELAVNACYERQIELIYGAPPYTGSGRAEAWRDARKAAA